MARSMQRWVAIGRLGNDPESHSFANGGMNARFRLATSEKWRDKGGDMKERTEWHNVVAHGKMAEIVNQLARKGTEVYVEGKVRTRSYQDKTTQKDVYVTEIHIDEWEGVFNVTADGKTRDGQSAPNQNQSGPAGNSGQYVPPGADPGFDDGDIPYHW